MAENNVKNSCGGTRLDFEIKKDGKSIDSKSDEARKT